MSHLPTGCKPQASIWSRVAKERSKTTLRRATKETFSPRSERDNGSGRGRREQLCCLLWPSNNDPTPNKFLDSNPHTDSTQSAPGSRAESSLLRRTVQFGFGPGPAPPRRSEHPPACFFAASTLAEENGFDEQNCSHHHLIFCCYECDSNNGELTDRVQDF